MFRKVIPDVVDLMVNNEKIKKKPEFIAPVFFMFNCWLPNQVDILKFLIRLLRRHL